jgi:hypothetical protein
MVLPPLCRRVTPKAGPTPINLTIHAPFLTNLFTWIGIAFCITQSAFCSRRNAASSARACNGKRDCVVANLFKVFDEKQDLSAGDDIMRVLAHIRDLADNGVASTPKFPGFLHLSEFGVARTGRCSSGAMLSRGFSRMTA